MAKITMTPVESSQIAALGYDADARQLHVQFKRAGGAAGSTYEYSNVDIDTYNGFFAKDDKGQPISIGRYFGQTIKADAKKFPYKKLPE